MPQEIDQKLVDFIPATSEALTVSERKQPEQVANSKWRTTARTRFHVETALRLQAQYGELERPKERTKWVKEQRAAWTSIEEVGAVLGSRLTFLTASNRHCSTQIYAGIS